MYTIKRDASAQTVTIDGFGSETINGGTTLALGASGTAAAVVLVSDSTQWHIVSNA
jgi:hypothetical protein